VTCVRAWDCELGVQQCYVLPNYQLFITHRANIFCLYDLNLQICIKEWNPQEQLKQHLSKETLSEPLQKALTCRRELLLSRSRCSYVL
jgi:hypothetical protein